MGTAGDDSNTSRYAVTRTHLSKSGGGEPSSRIRLGYTGNQELCMYLQGTRRHMKTRSSSLRKE